MILKMGEKSVAEKAVKRVSPASNGFENGKKVCRGDQSVLKMAVAGCESGF
jgi:hypothetical protein